ncbi:unnamed protein product [Polarella glacialis]|uniref:VWFA domain-containing protein n=1 Tax=Polarella glacialis TaxID=89957 RepID=A0A813J269_POLGL|nr:unnamed protein product [Polarella glacialis]
MAGKYLVTRRGLNASEVGQPSARSRGGKWWFYVDSSASTADTFVARAVMLEAFLNQTLEKVAPTAVAVLAFDLDVVTLLPEASLGADLGRRAADALRARLPLGMTRLDRVLAHAARSGADFVVLLTDAMATLGDRGALLPRNLQGLPKTSKVFVLNFGNKMDLEVATEVAGVGGGRALSVAASSNASTAAARMSRAWDDLTAPIGNTGKIVGLTGGTAVYPAIFFDLQPDSEVVYFTIPESSMDLANISATSLQIGDQLLATPASTQASQTFSPLLQREGVRAELAVLAEKRTLSLNRTVQDSLAADMVLLSTTQRVLCPLTALLVLETEKDFERFGISRKARNDILIVTTQGVELERPSSAAFQKGVKELDAQEPENDLPDTDSFISSDSMQKSEQQPSVSTAQDSSGRLSKWVAAALVAVASLPTAGGLFGLERSWSLSVLSLAFLGVTVTLQGCFEERRYDDDSGYPEMRWLNMDTWAAQFLSNASQPSTRTRDEAQLWAQALAASNRTEDRVCYFLVLGRFKHVFFDIRLVRGDRKSFSCISSSALLVHPVFPTVLLPSASKKFQLLHVFCLACSFCVPRRFPSVDLLTMLRFRASLRGFGSSLRLSPLLLAIPCIVI